MSESASVADWSVLEDPEVKRVLKIVIRKVTERSGGVLDLEDVEQEAYILVATRATEVRERLAKGSALLNQWLTWMVGHIFEAEVARARRHVQVDFEEDGSIQEPEYLRGFREDDGVERPVEARVS